MSRDFEAGACSRKLIAIVVGIVVVTNNANTLAVDAASNAITESKGSAADPVKSGVVGASDPRKVLRR